jgi:DNA-binding NarL/FixJ family response regulator
MESIRGPVGERAPSASTVTGQAIPVDEAVALARSIGQEAEYAFSDTGYLSPITPQDHDRLQASASKAGNPDGLTARELEVLRLVAAGHSNREIADVLVLSLRTIERHINNLYAKIGARGKADATAYAFRHGLT